MGQTVPGILQLIQTGWQSWKACRNYPTIGIYWKLFVVFICSTDCVGFKLMFLIHSIQEQGDLKLRVRTLESERAFQRVAAVQRTVGNVSSADLSSIFFFFQLMIIEQIINLSLFASFTISSIIKKRIYETWTVIKPWGFQGQDPQNKEKIK